LAGGTPPDAEVVKQHLEGFMGQYVKQADYNAPLWNKWLTVGISMLI